MTPRRLSLAVPFFLVTALSAQDRNQYAGTWKMDIPRSESAHQEIPIESSTVVIATTGEGLSIDTTRQDKGSPLFHEVLNVKLDGSETTNDGNSGVSVRAKARWETGKLVVETARELQGSTITTHEVHSLSPDGREMTIEKTLTVQHGYQGASPSIAPTTGHGKDLFVRTAK